MAGSIIAYTAAGVLGLGLLGWRFRQEPKTYGTASWLEPWPALKRGLFKRKGILVGDWTGLLPVYYEDTHAISFGPSGSGKGTATILPNLLNTRFAFINDPGGENAAVAIREWRRAGYEVCVINPFGMFMDKPWALPRQGFNPLDILDPASETFASEALLIAELLIVRSGKEDGSSLYFKNAGTSFLQALLMHVITSLPEGERLVRAGGWETFKPALLLGRDLYGATLGIIGLGRIGQAVARRAVGFSMRVLYHRGDANAAHQLGAESASLDDLLRQSDFISLHVPLTPETKNLIGARELALMKSTAILVNTARGGVVDPVALYEALRDGVINAAALDVTEPEPIPMDDPLLTLDNCLIVPHIGSASVATRERMVHIAVDNLLAGLRGERLPHCVNPEVYKEQE